MTQSRSTTRPGSIRDSSARGRQARPGDRRRRVPRPGGPVRLRQVDLAADARRARGRQRGLDLDRRPRRHRRAAEGPRHRDGVPELRALPAHDGRRQHGLRAEDRRRAQGRDPQAGSSEAAKILDLERVPRPQAEGPLRWPAPAGRDGPGDRAPAAGVPHGRAAVEPRRQAPRADPHARSPRCSAASGSPRSTSPTTRSRR